MTVDLYRHFDAERRLLYVGILLSAIPKAKPIKGPQVWFNWKRKGLKGYTPVSERNGENG